LGKIIIQTKRLVLEELTEEHFEDLSKLLANKRVHQFFPGTLDRKQAHEFLDKVRCQYQNNGTSFWAVISKDTHRFIGICGLLKQTIDNIEELEVGYRIDDSYWGMGIGTEAAAGCIEYARDILKRSSIISLIRDVNFQSIRVAEKNGLVYEKDTLFHDLVHRVYRKNLQG